MAVREFDGTDDVITLDNGAVTSLAGAASFVLLAKPLSTSPDFKGIFVANGSSPVILGLFSWNDDETLGCSADGLGDAPADVNLSTDWQWIGFSKPTGSGAPVIHRSVLGSGTWIHAATGVTFTTGSAPLTDYSIGALRDTAFYGLRVAVAAVFTHSLSDAEWESFVDQTSDVYNASGGAPAALWQFNQASTDTSVQDLVGTAHQSALVGTSVITDDNPPGFSFEGTGTESAEDVFVRVAGEWVAADRAVRVDGAWV